MNISHGKVIVRGPKGRRGFRGRGLYEIWLDHNEGTPEDFLEEMRSKVPGPRGPSIFDEWNERKVERGEEEGTYEDFICSLMDAYFGIGILTHISGLEAGVLYNSLDIAEILRRIKYGDISEFLKLCAKHDNCIKRVHKTIKEHQVDFKAISDKVRFLALDAANRSESEAMYKRANGQTGILACRNYSITNNDFKRRHTNPIAPSHIHSHPDYKGLVGSGEIEFVANGLVGQSRHRDYKLEQAIQGDYLATAPMEPKSHTEAFQELSVNEQIKAVQEMFKEYEDGGFPEMFSFRLSYLEVWLEEFTPELTETYSSDRHKMETATLEAAIELLNYHSTSGFKPVFENLTFEPTVVRYVDNFGNAKVGILKNRMVCKDLSEMGDLRCHLSVVNDPSATLGRERTTRWKLDDCLDGWTIMDEIMGKVPGMDGAGSEDTEIYSVRGVESKIQKYDGTGDLNSAYYSRKGSRVAGASNVRRFNRGFTDPMMFVATTNHKEVSAQAIYGEHKRYSYAIPMELLLATPLDGWNPHKIPFKTTVTGGGTDHASARDGYNYKKNYFINPVEVFSRDLDGDINPASTGVNTYYTRLPNGNIVRVAGSGEWINLPAINGIDTKKRFPIYVEHQEGSKAHQEATESWIDTASGVISNTIDIHEARDAIAYQVRVTDSLFHEMKRMHGCMLAYNADFAASAIKSSIDIFYLQAQADKGTADVTGNARDMVRLKQIVAHVEEYISDLKAGVIKSSIDILDIQLQEEIDEANIDDHDRDISKLKQEVHDTHHVDDT